MHAIFGMTLFICIKWLVNHCAYWNKKYFFLYYLNKRWTMTKTKYEDIVRCLHGDTPSPERTSGFRIQIPHSLLRPTKSDEQYENPTNNTWWLRVPYLFIFHCDSLFYVLPLWFTCLSVASCLPLGKALQWVVASTWNKKCSSIITKHRKYSYCSPTLLLFWLCFF